MKVLVADKFEKVGVDGLKDLGCEVLQNADLKPEDLPNALRETGANVLIVRSTKVTGEALDAAEHLDLIIRAGAGYDTIDVKRASSLGVFVANCPGKNSVAVAELVMGLLLSCDRRIPDQTAELRNGQWNKKEYSKSRGLYGRTFGVIGLGRIGREIVTRAQAFGMKIVAWSRSLTLEEAAELGVEYAATPIDVARISDAVTINLAATSETENFVNAEFLDAMKPGAYLINTSRGSLVDEEALINAIREKGIRAGLDVYRNEPGASDKSFSTPIAGEPGVYGTHHIGASTDQAQIAIAHEVIRIIQAYMDTGVVLNCVNRLARSAATHMISVRHRNRPGVLAHVFTALAEQSINVEEVENIIYHGAEATLARIHVDSKPPAALLERIEEGNENIIAVSITDL